jgi:hypothetical protein
MLLNDSFVQRQAAAFAARVRREARGEGEEQVRQAYKLALAREPTSHEIELARQLIANQERAFEQVSRRITFRPDVPESIYNAYQDKLRAEDHFIGPREGWSYRRGAWSKDYEGIRTVDRVRGPFALWTGRELILQPASEFASLIFGGRATNGLLHGYEIVLDARQQGIALLRHSTNTISLAQTPAFIRHAVPHAVKVEVREDEIRVWLDGSEQPRLEARGSAANTQPGRVGIRAWGAPVSVDELMLNAEGQWLDALASSGVGHPKPSSHRALESFCLMLLNLNELVYVD